MGSPATNDTHLQSTADGAVLYAAAALPAACTRFDPEWFEPEYWRAQGTWRPVGAGRGAAWRIELAGAPCVLRHFRRGGMVARVLGDRYLWNGPERTRAFAEFTLLDELTRRNLNVPAPVAARYQRRGVHYRADLITRCIEPAQTLAERWRSQGLDAVLAGRIGSAIAEFHAAGACHADLNAHNVLIDARAIWLIDWDRGALRSPARSWQLGNMARLRRSLLKIGAARDGETGFDRSFWTPLMAAYERVLGAGTARVTAGGAHG